MQPSGSYPRRSLPGFVNYLPRHLELAASGQAVRSADSMIAPTGMTTFGSGLTFAGANMGQGHPAPDSAWRHKAPGGDSARLDRHVAHDKPTPRLSDDTWSMHYDCTNQAPYTPSSGPVRSITDEMMTQNSFLTLPKENASHDLAFFLRTTGPIPPHRRPSKVGDRTSGPSQSSKNAFALFRRSQRRAKSSLSDVLPRDEPKKETCLTGVPEDLRVLNKALRDEGGLLKEVGTSSRVPRGVVQKVSTTGKKYYALQIPSTVSEETKTPDIEPIERLTDNGRNDVWDSHIAVSFGDDVRTEEVLDNWLMSLSKEEPGPSPLSPPRKSSAHLPMDDDSIRLTGTSPIRPAASNPPTPAIEHQTSPMPAVIRSKKHPHLYVPARILPQQDRTIQPMPKISLPGEEFPVKHPASDDNVDIRQPMPRRLKSHPLLLEDTVPAVHTYTRSVSDSPAPPPRSPLRAQHGSNTIEDVLDQRQRGREITPSLAPSVLSGREYNEGTKRIRPTVVTDCTGPIKRPKSRGADVVFRKERENRIRARKLRDRPSIASLVQPGVSRQTSTLKLKKSRAAQMPELRPPPLLIGNSSPTSSETSFRKVTESTCTPIVPASPQQEEKWPALSRYLTPVSSAEQPRSHFSAISPTRSVLSEQTSMTLSPVMLVAESVPPPKARSTHRPPKLVIKDSRQYAARPRSASVKRRSCQQAMTTPPRPSTPVSAARAFLQEDMPPLPSPPPNRALPPTPPRCGPHRNRHADGHPADQPCLRTNSAKGQHAGIDARLEALEKQNALLSAALMAVLKTNGAYNLPQSPNTDGPDASSRRQKHHNPTAWEHRIARRSAASHAASSSNGSALEMYMTTRRGSRGGY